MSKMTRYFLRPSRRGLPTIVTQDKYGLIKWFPWDFAQSWLVGLRLRKMGFLVSPMMLKAWKEFRREYMFPESVQKDANCKQIGICKPEPEP